MSVGFKRIAAFAICFLMLSVFCTAAETGSEKGTMLSPALKYFAGNIELKKSGEVNTNISFSKQDFNDVFGKKTEFIKIESLPDSASGKLTLYGIPVSKNQLVSAEDFDKIVFIPAKDTVSNTAFTFTDAAFDGKELAVNCTLYVLEKENTAPSVSEQIITTGKNISAFKFLDVKDNDGDDFSVNVVSYPKHGAVYFSEEDCGYFCYTPQKNYVGKDSFEYTVTDVYGNTSAVSSVEIQVEKRNSDIYFDDLEKHWAHNSAVKTAARGLMTGEPDENGALNFNPDGAVTRGDFLAMALITAGKEKEISFVSETSFDDDNEIPVNIKSYAEYAKNNGIVGGYTLDNGTTVFKSTDIITRAEAAVIVDRILALENAGKVSPVFANSASAPVWARDSVANVSVCGIFNGSGLGEISSEKTLSRAETAEILCNIEEYIEENKSNEKPVKKRTLFDFFGLLG